MLKAIISKFFYIILISIIFNYSLGSLDGDILRSNQKLFYLKRSIEIKKMIANNNKYSLILEKPYFKYNFYEFEYIYFWLLINKYI